MKSYCAAKWAAADRRNILAPFRSQTNIGFQGVMNFHAFPAGSLVGADFSKLNMVGADFSGQDLTCARFHLANLGRASFLKPEAHPLSDDDLRKMNVSESFIVTLRAGVNQAGPGSGIGTLHSGASFVDTKLDHADLSDAIAEDADFSYASLRCTNFAGTDLSQAVLRYPVDVEQASGCRTNFGDHARLTLLEIRTIGIGTPAHRNWPLVSFDDVQVAHSEEAAVSFDHLEMSGARLARADLYGLNFTASNLAGVNLHEARLSHANFTESVDDGANFSGADLSTANFTCAQLYGTGQWEPADPALACPTHYKLSGPITTAEASFDNARLEDTQFSRAMLDHASFRFATMTQADLNDASLRGSQLSSNDKLDPVSVINATFEHVDFSDAGLNSVDFSRDDLVGANFSRNTMHGTLFQGAQLSTADFTEVKLDNVNFKGAELLAVKFSGTRFTRPTNGETGAGSNLSCAQLGGADFTNAEVDYANFAYAVMPAASDCCPTVDGARCGMVPETHKIYNEVVFPKTTSATITCPNGDHGPCTGAQWKLGQDWMTANCSESRQSMQMWSRPACGDVSGSGGTDGNGGIAIPDHALRRCILNRLHKEEVITQADADRVTRLDCDSMEIASLEGLQHLHNLDSLRLSGNRLMTFEVPSPGLPHLVTLDVTANQLTSLNLIRLPRLKHVYASRNQLRSIDFDQRDMTQLQSLDVSFNQLTCIDLTLFQALQSADLSNNRLGTVTGTTPGTLSALTGMNELELDHNLLKSIGDITGLLQPGGGASKLNDLTLSCNPSFQCKTLGSNDGTAYPLLANTGCVQRHDPKTEPWVYRAQPDCSP